MGTQTKVVKFIPKFIGVYSRPVMIVGQNPGRQRRGSESGLVWEGNRSGDYLMDIIERYELSNLILTNISNYQGEITKEHLLEGVVDIATIGDEFEVKKIICLGDFSYDVMSVGGGPCEVIKLPHPSWILRFNKDRKQYENKLVKEING